MRFVWCSREPVLLGILTRRRRHLQNQQSATTKRVCVYLWNFQACVTFRMTKLVPSESGNLQLCLHNGWGEKVLHVLLSSSGAIDERAALQDNIVLTVKSAINFSLKALSSWSTRRKKRKMPPTARRHVAFIPAHKRKLISDNIRWKCLFNFADGFFVASVMANAHNPYQFTRKTVTWVQKR